MENRYKRNRIYLTEKEQQLIKKTPILLGGAGIGSVIAECALRFGFENITIVDGDIVETSNLNRQNYTEADVSKSKVKSLAKRLLDINPNANIITHNFFITKDNIEALIDGHKIAINALDFSSDIPLLFDKLCSDKNIPVLHPYNLGWGGLVAVINPNSILLDSISEDKENFNELNVVEYAIKQLKSSGKPQDWIEEIIEKYKNEDQLLPPPQLSIGSWLIASICTNLLFKIATDKPVKLFPEFYLSTINS